jgi:hypothetical protein
MTIEAILTIGLLTIIVVFALLTGAVVALVRQVGDSNRLLESILDELRKNDGSTEPEIEPPAPAFFFQRPPN